MAAITQLRFGLSGMPYGSFAGKGARTVERLTQMRFGLSWRLGSAGGGVGVEAGTVITLRVHIARQITRPVTINREIKLRVER